MPKNKAAGMDEGDRLLIYGANGATGRRIVELAVAAGLRPVVSGRRREALDELAQTFGVEIRPAGLSDVGSVLDGVRVVVSCVGPYIRYGVPVVRAAVEAGAHYVDCTGEPEYLQRVIDEFDQVARSGGSVLVPG